MDLVTIHNFQKIEVCVRQITENYTKKSLINQQVLCVTNFPPRQIGPFISKVLTLGVPSENNSVILIQPNTIVPLGGMVY